MSGGWSIDVPGTRAVISSTATSIAGLEDSVTALNAAFAGIAGAVPSPVVQQALGSVVEASVVPAVRNVINGGVAVVTGTSQAVGHYESGDLVMAATAMRSSAVPMPAGIRHGGLLQ